MKQEMEQVFGNDYVSFRDKVKARIGEDRARRYGEITAVLALAEYRLEQVRDDCDFGITCLLDYDALFGKKQATRAVFSVLAPVLWAATRTKYAFRKKAEIRTAFSDAFLFSRRYAAVRKRVDEKQGCTALMTFLDAVKIETRSTKELIRESLRLDAGRVKPVWLPRFSVAGGKLQRELADYYRLIHRDTYGTEPVTDAEWDAVLPRLRDAFTRRTAWLTKRLGKENLRLYLTVNQYHLRDLMIIRACRNAGIPTLQQEHHAMEFIRLPFDPERPMQRFSLVNHYGFWSRTEMAFHRKVFRYDNLLDPPEENRYLVTGNTEVSYEQALAYQRQYPTQRKLTYMTTGIEAETLSPEALEAYEKWRWALFAGLREFSRKQGIPVCLRYTPFREMYFREREIPTLKEWGFTISDSVPENLMEDLCTSMAVMSSTSSVLATARLFGKMIFRVEDVSIRYIHVDDSVHEVRIADLPELTIPENAGTGPIDPAGFFDMDRLIRMLDEAGNDYPKQTGDGQ